MHSAGFIDVGIYLVVNSEFRIRMYISLMERKVSSYLLSIFLYVYGDEQCIILVFSSRIDRALIRHEKLAHCAFIFVDIKRIYKIL